MLPDRMNAQASVRNWEYARCRPISSPLNGVSDVVGPMSGELLPLRPIHTTWEPLVRRAARLAGAARASNAAAITNDFTSIPPWRCRNGVRRDVSERGHRCPETQRCKGVRASSRRERYLVMLRSRSAGGFRIVPVLENNGKLAFSRPTP